MRVKVNMKNKLQCFFTLVIMAQLTPAVYSQSLGGAHSTTVSSLNLSPEALAIGGGAVALASRLSHIQDQPAALDSSLLGQVQVGYFSYLAGARGGQFTYAMTQPKRKMNLAFGMRYLGYGKMTKYDNSGNELGTFSAMDYQFSGMVSTHLDSTWTLGIQPKIIYSQYDVNKRVALALDAGVFYNNPIRQLTFSLSLSQIGGVVKDFTATSASTLPFQIQCSVSKKPKHAPFRWFLTLRQLQQWKWDSAVEQSATVSDTLQSKWKNGEIALKHILIGTEVILGPHVSLLFGYDYNRRQEMIISQAKGMVGFSMGTSVNLKRWNIAYSRSIMHTSGGMNSISIAFVPRFAF
jgi:hypothetical protein